MFHAEFDATHDPVKRDQILANAFSTVPGAELDSINVEYFLFRDNHDVRLEQLEIRVDELDHFVVKNVTGLNHEVENLYHELEPIEILDEKINRTEILIETQESEVQDLQAEFLGLSQKSLSNEVNIENLADEVDRLDERRNFNEYLRNDMSAVKEQQNLQEIKHLMMTQEMRRIITAQDQKIAKQSADLSRVQAALIEERYLKRIEMADYEKRVKESLDIEMQIIMAKMTTFFDSKMNEYDQKQQSKNFPDQKLLEEILSSRDDVENAEMIKIQIQ